MKAKRRLQLIGLGVVLTLMVIAWADYQWQVNDQILIEEIERIDISNGSRIVLQTHSTASNIKVTPFKRKNDL